ncbi:MULTISPECIES: ATP-binding protein [Asticcacaulis]|uniref:sensor histidine kinase n=1 Tax=Asticcacaulis TaxID=76890 RepID=UPI001AE873D8|nr:MULTISPECIES: ATP-binding protein [Asticcacaulis]MBP2159222.1 PAS domain S-box-containing protein [Asticcacaulis solisilvae]MDR6800267.1 PAS domain S-box-containing protein [Asticcacaulis sp. BE141]
MWLPWGINVKHIYLAFFSIVSIALCAFTMIIHSQYKTVEDLNDDTVYQYETIGQTRNIYIGTLEMENGVRGYILSGDDRFLKPYREAGARLRAQVVTLRNVTYREKAFFAQTNVWLDSIDDIQKTYERQIAAVRTHGRGAVSVQDLGRQKAAMDGLRERLDDSVAMRLSSLKAHVKQVESQRANFIYILIIGAIIGIGIVLIGTITIIKLETENQAFEDESRKAEMRFRTVMNGINDGLYELNFVSETFYASREFKAMLGYGEDEIADTIDAVMSLVHPDDLPKVLEVRRQYIMRQSPVYANVFRMKHKDGTWRWVLSRGVGTWDKFGQIRTLIGTHTDITEQKEREEEYKQLHADMEAFTYITSHDMRSPLVNLKGFSHELAMAVEEVRELIEPQKRKMGADTWARLEALLKADIPESLGFIGKAVDRMDTLTTAILDLSRIGKYVYREDRVSSRDIFDKCLGAQSYELTGKGVEVVVGHLPELITDPVALEQIFSNLLDNAVKYLQPGRPGRIEVSCVETSREYVFSIGDNGRGIEADDRQKVFHIFRRARNTGDVRGLGLGMAFVKATLRKLSGAIWFDSTVDVGTTFYFSLPKKLPAAANAELPQETRALAS